MKLGRIDVTLYMGDPLVDDDPRFRYSDAPEILWNTERYVQGLDEHWLDMYDLWRKHYGPRASRKVRAP